MNRRNNGDPQELVRVTLELPVDIVVWIDELREQLGLRTRGPLIAQLLRELASPSAVKPEDPNAPAA